MHATTYVGDRHTRAAGWSVLGALALLALVFDIWALSTPPDTSGIMVRQIVGAAAITGVVVLTAVRVGPSVGSTTVTASGITVRTLLRVRTIAWSDVRSIEVTRPGAGRSGMRVVEHSRSGPRYTVLAGVLSTIAYDPRFDEDTRAIAALWTRANGQPQDS
ncbi:hypothetical protein GXW82_08330 [Streptacidiphilus sp. 4-A2]|nr:hypothetical protein [Streptacidiphilus sp. 4-A2]